MKVVKKINPKIFHYKEIIFFYFFNSVSTQDVH